LKWWLSVFFFVNGSWIPGEDMPGWSSRPFATEQECLDRKLFAERECRNYPLDFEALWICNYGEPASAPPAPPPTIEC
jgi:hypothetical protein